MKLMNIFGRGITFCVFLVLNLGAGAQTINLYVGQSASGQAKGTKDAPFTSFDQVSKRIGQLRADKNTAPVTVWIAPGRYELEKPLSLSPEQNSVTDGIITFRPLNGGTVLLSGGKHINNWVEVEPGHWVALLPEVKAGNWYFRQLFSGHKRLIRARTPNVGFMKTRGGLSLTYGKNPQLEGLDKNGKHWLSRCGFAFNEGDIRYWDDWKNAEILTYHSWEASWQAIMAIDTAKNEVYFTSPSRYPVGRFGNNMRYRIENIQEALDQPGEWFLDRTKGELHLLTNPGEDPHTMDIHAPRLERLLDFTGVAEKPVANVTFENIDFQYSCYQMGLYDIAPNWPAEIQKSIPFFPTDIHPGYTGAQSAPTVGGSLNFKYAENISFEQCGMRHLGAIGVVIDRGCRGIKLNGCDIYDLGAGGVYIGFDVRLVEAAGVPKTDAPRENVISNCRISSLGHVHPAAVGVWIAQASDNKIVNNEISYVSYSGISLGWTWGFEPNYTKNNYIGKNYIHHVAQSLGDAAGMYSLGDCTGCVYDGNFIDEINIGEGVYGVVDAMGFDECSSHILIKNTVVGRTSGKVASFGRASSAELQTWENNNFDIHIARPVFDNRAGMESKEITVHAVFHPYSTFLNMASSGREQRWIFRKNGSEYSDGAYGMYIIGKNAVAYVNIGGGKENLYRIVATNVVQDDNDNTATMSYDGDTFCFYFNSKQIGKQRLCKERSLGNGKLEIAPIASNSLRNGISSLCIINKAVNPEDIQKTSVSFSWQAPKAKNIMKNTKKVIKAAGPDEKYKKNFLQ